MIFELEKRVEEKGGWHKPVMVEEVMQGLDIMKRKVIVEANFGLGGHTREMLLRNPEVKVFAFELDENNLKQGLKGLSDFKERVVGFNENFVEMKEILEEEGVLKVDGVFFDLGLSLVQVSEGSRGFSFMRDGPLDMRFGKKQSLTAEEVVNKYSEKELVKIFFEFGEERFSKRIAREIVEYRKKERIVSTGQLVDLIKKVVKVKKGRNHPATKVFQALRIEVNSELEVLKRALESAIELLEIGGRIVVLSYHSLEDRVVKNEFRDKAREFLNLENEMETRKLVPKLKLIKKKVVLPSESEVRVNPSARSAKLRFAERI